MDPIAAENFKNFQLDVAALPNYEAVQLEPISRKYLIKLQVGTGVSLLFLVVGFAVGYYFVPEEFKNYLIGAIVLMLALFLWTFFNNIMYVKRSGYALREQDIIFKRGFLFEKTTVVPFNRIQHVSVERSFLDKVLNIATLKIFTAGGSGSDINIPGIKPGIAGTLKEEISERIFRHA
ncbi:PH domain-containing protein [Salinimicrobium oceani]|uniref:PH domain-containing protein n=1 Tax=Salinimicrobium oceani TaxID=2722702 RepID=A0ABX1CYZ6_9FLAO|nr:PH domain-containing protein [Salinimicrobium oceani]NJW53493.1 PH domain-containing protein [Salinimicrobium oceani]